jgi:hypothetical protein
MDCVLLYFILLKKINNGIVHKYFLLCILLGFVISEVLFKKFKFTFQIKKWYNIYMIGDVYEEKNYI